MTATAASARIGNRVVQSFLDIVSRLSAGAIDLILPDGARYTLGSSGAPGPQVTMRIHRWRALRKFLTQGEFGFVESYLDGDWDCSDLTGIIQLGILNAKSWNSRSLQGLAHKLWNRIAHMMRANSRRGAKRNIAAHYDLGNAFYEQWLDQTMTYSSAYFDKPGQSLPDAQIQKYRRIARLLDLKPEHHILEIGFGWGGFAELALKEYGCRLTGLTLSAEQLRFARERLQKQGLSDRADLRLQDYRDVSGTFDRIASIEMFEAVGEAHWGRYFDMIRERLARGGAAALQIITIAEERFDNYRRNPDFIQRYIFPGGMLPSIESLKAHVDRARLRFDDTLMFGDSYAATLRHWRDRFLGAWQTIEPLGFDERFRRMWEMYLAYCEGGFRTQAIDVGQFKLVRP